MTVGELLKILEDVNPHLPIFLLDGTGIKSVKVINTLNYTGVESFVEFLSYQDSESHTEDLGDSLIERETGFKNRNELIEAYAELKYRMDSLDK